MSDDDYLWDPTATPDPEIARLENALRPASYVPAPFVGDALFEGQMARHRGQRSRWRLVAVAAGLILTVVTARAVSRRMVEPWTVTALSGQPALEGAPIDAKSRLTPGMSLRTNAEAEAQINVGRIGKAEIGPNSHVRLIRAEGTEHRLALEEGTMHARIWAPPRFFLVETPSALAIDLGCVYSLRVAADGSGLLRVESGQVELVEGTRRALVLAGNAASLRPGRGPGLPYPVDASPAFLAALTAYEQDANDSSLDSLLAIADRRTTITLWHLLSRVDRSDRERVLSRLSVVAPLPVGVTTGAVLRLERRALERWKDGLEASWTTESVPRWKRAWRRTWTFIMTVG